MVTLGTSTDPTPPRQLDRSELVLGDQRQVTNRISTARVHLDGALSMVENDGWCPDVTKQLPAVQGLIESTSREVSRHHPESPIYAAFCDGRGDGVVVELMEALRYDGHVLWALP
jgi:CsoR family transcriptional regulator, copper-sensing transcriptional repressor